MDQNDADMRALRRLRSLVMALLIVMILAVITVVTLFVMRFSSTGEVALGTDFIAVRNGDVIEVYKAETGRLHQTITLQEP